MSEDPLQLTISLSEFVDCYGLPEVILQLKYYCEELQNCYEEDTSWTLYSEVLHKAYKEIKDI